MNFHSQISKTELSANQKYCMLHQTKITRKAQLWWFGFTEQLSDWIHIYWIHTLVTKGHKICLSIWWDENRTAKLCCSIKSTHMFLRRSDSTPTCMPLSSRGWYWWFRLLKKLATLCFFITYCRQMVSPACLYILLLALFLTKCIFLLPLSILPPLFLFNVFAPFKS